MDVKATHDKLLDHFGPEVVLGVTEAAEGVRDPSIAVHGTRIDKVCLYCRVEADLGFDFCQSITAVDQPANDPDGGVIACIYHLYSYARKSTLVLKTETPRQKATLPTVTGLWSAADWYEREVYDLFGVQFEGHTDLRRLLLPADWPGHPMRKDWVEPEEYRGMPTTRENPLDLLEEA